MGLRHNLYIKKEKLKRKIGRLRTGSCIVLLYHRIRDTDYDPQRLCVSKLNFEDQIQYLRKHYHIITTDTFNERLKNRKPFKNKSLLITFDDGYADNYFNALPILERYGLQSVFYISLNNINTNNIFWWDELDTIVRWPEKINQQALNELLKLKQKTTLQELYDHYLVALKTAQNLRQREVCLSEIRSLRTLSDSEKEEHRCLSKTELINLSLSSQAVIGAHSVNHLSLGHLSNEDQVFEIKSSVIELNNLTGKTIELFSFPYGEKHNYNNYSIKVCKETGLTHAAANYLGYVDTNSDLFSFPRFVVRNDSPEILLKKLKAVL